MVFAVAVGAGRERRRGWAVVIPRLVPAMQALVDQELADLADLFDRYPTYSTYLTAGYGAREIGRFVAADILARLADVSDERPDWQLKVITARVHAYLEVCK